ncbi:MAG: PilN domain-containing protein [Candidatus Omnitrophica bacterium]|nr:PilN domain-containing protein [Candidatus Omnitrophota bacterium]
MRNIKRVLEGFSLRPREVAGVDLDAHKIIVCEVEKRGQELTLKHVYIKEFPQAGAAADNLRGFLKENKFAEAKYSCVGAISAEESFFKGFATKTNIFKDKGNIPSFLSRQPLPVNLNDCYWDYLLTGKNLNLVAARKEIVDAQFNAFKEAGVQCAFITAVPFALYNVFTFNYPDKKNFCILHVRWQCSNLCIFEDGRFWIHTISIGKDKLAAGGRIAEDVISEFAQEIKRLLNSNYLQMGSSHKPLEEIFLSGEPIAEDLQPLSSSLGINVAYLDPLKKISRAVSVDKPSQLSLSIGLCASFLSPSAFRLNLLKEKQRSLDDTRHFDTARKAFSAFMLALLALLVFLNFRMGKAAGLKDKELERYKFISDKVVPGYKTLLEEEKFVSERLQYLETRAKLHSLWLKMLRDISVSKADDMRVTLLDARNIDGLLVVMLGGRTADYSDINDFLSSLRQNEYVSGVKIVSSAQGSGKESGVEFKVRLDIGLEKGAAAQE